VVFVTGRRVQMSKSKWVAMGAKAISNMLGRARKGRSASGLGAIEMSRLSAAKPAVMIVSMCFECVVEEMKSQAPLLRVDDPRALNSGTYFCFFSAGFRICVQG
jgi:hypothetical protein